jgi:hypothetical protein
MIQFNDNLKLTPSTRKITDEGYLKATAALTRVGLQDYRLSDITGNVNDTKIVKVLRPATTVFSDETIESAKLKPITMYHPSTMVDSENHHNLSVGTIGENVHQLDQHRLGASIIITNKAIIDDIMNGKVSEVSMGYSADLKQESGVFNNEHYDYIFDGAMKINHCAIVPKGRCGESVSILDKKEGDLMTKDEIKELLLNDMDFKEVLKSLLNDLQQPKETQNEKVEESIEESIEESVDETEESADPNMDSSADATVEESSNVSDQPSDESVAEVEEQVITVEAKDSIEEQVKVRVKIIGKASSILKDEALDNLSNREILEKIFVDHKDKSDDYLVGMLDATIDNHNKAKYSLKAISDSYGTKMSYNKRYSALEIQKL